MLRFVVLAVVIALASAQGYGHQRRAHAPTHSRGYGYENAYEEPTPYKFAYDVKNDYGATLNRQESGDGYGNVQGSYGYTDSYGLYRQVEYTADDYGYRAQIKTNEPGTDNQNPADVYITADPIKVDYKPQRSYAPVHKQVAHAPAHRQVSYAPAHRQVSHAPAHRQVSYAPVHRQVSHAPAHRQVSYAPVHRQVSYAPVHKQVAYAPSHGQVSYAPVKHQTVHRSSGYGQARKY